MVRGETGESGQVQGGWECHPGMFGHNFIGTRASRGFQVTCFRKLSLAARFAVGSRGIKDQEASHGAD